MTAVIWAPAVWEILLLAFAPLAAAWVGYMAPEVFSERARRNRKRLRRRRRSERALVRRKRAW